MRVKKASSVCVETLEGRDLQAALNPGAVMLNPQPLPPRYLAMPPAEVQVVNPGVARGIIIIGG